MSFVSISRNIVILLVFASVSISQSSPTLIKQPSAQRIGTTKFVWADTSRTDQESTEPGKPRQLIVQMWYPANHRATGDVAPYMLEYSQLRLALEQKDSNFSDRAAVFGSLSTAAVLNTSVLGSKRPYPVVLFSHGRGMPRALYTSFYQSLAAAGYVVAAIDHPGMGFTSMPDSRIARLYPPLGHDAPAGLRGKPEEERDVFWKPTELYLGADHRFVADQIVQLNRGKGSQLFRGKLDENRMIHIGHSSGFAGITCAHDARLKACVNLEGSPEMTERRFGLPIPILTVRSPNRRGQISLIHAASRVPTYDVEIKGANHNSISDLFILGPPEGRAVAERNLKIMTDYIIDFLDHTLLRKQLRLLAGPAKEYPEVTLFRYNSEGKTEENKPFK